MREHFSAWIGRWALGHAALGAQEGYTRHATSQFAAAISYRVLFSLVPLVSFVAAIADALLPDKQRDAVARWLAGVVPGQALDSSVEQALTGSRVAPTVAGVVSLAVLLWAASGMMGAIRIAFRVIWENDLRRTFVRSKLLDFVLVLGVGVVAVAAIGAIADRPGSRRDRSRPGRDVRRRYQRPGARGGHRGARVRAPSPTASSSSSTASCRRSGRPSG